tara:strand:- start:7221 stop:8030 length:810 start_codon:yes stop_codon:yes gene_type:complete
MKHVITLSGNSKRFTAKGYPHKSLLNINGKTSIEVFIDLIPDFHDYETIFLCRNEDLESTDLEKEIKKHSNGKAIGIESNQLGPLYSLTNIHDNLLDDEDLLITYIDAPQKLNITNMLSTFSDVDGGLTSHNLHNPHWRNNKYYCFVRHDGEFNCQEVIEKYNFENIFLDLNQNFDLLGLSKSYFSKPDLSNCGGSNGSYYFKTGKIFKDYSNSLMSQNKTVNGEYYVTQLYQEMIADGLKVKLYECPYVSFGIPEDVEDYIFWQNWFK